MKQFFAAVTAMAFMQFFTINANAQLTTSADGGNKKAAVSEQIGITNVTIHYNRPAVKKREGHIFWRIGTRWLCRPGFWYIKSCAMARRR